MFIEGEREREKWVCWVGTKSATAAVAAAVEMVRYMNEFKLHRVVFACVKLRLQ